MKTGSSALCAAASRGLAGVTAAAVADDDVTTPGITRINELLAGM